MIPPFVPPPKDIDPELKTLLRRHDPAESISQRLCADLEMRITAAVIRQPQSSKHSDLALLSFMPRSHSWLISWPVAGLLSIVFGIIIGISISVLSETPVQHYTVANIMAGPWDQLEQ